MRAVEETLDSLYLNSIAFPVVRGSFTRFTDEQGVPCWSIEIHCGESPQLDWRSCPDEREEAEYDWLAGTEPSLYTQMLPLPVQSPEDLVGRTFNFPQTPDDDPADWNRGVGWLFFCIYLYEHDLVYPATVTFAEKRGQKYRVQISGSYPANNVEYSLRVETWLEWENPSRP